VEPDEDTVDYTDGSATSNGRPDARAGSGAYYGQDDLRNLAIRVPSELKQSNNVAEILAIKETIEYNPKDITLRIRSASKLAIDGLTTNLRKWEDEGFLTRRTIT
jgi:ribonuclease HI